MLDRCRQCHISLNLKKCIFCALFRMLLGHVVCKKGLLMDPAKIEVIMDLQPPTLITELRETLGHMGYYRKFIKGYFHIKTPIEKLLKKEEKLQWNKDYQKGLDTLEKN
jgi:hypothetical protein